MAETVEKEKGMLDGMMAVLQNPAFQAVALGAMASQGADPKQMMLATSIFSGLSSDNKLLGVADAFSMMGSGVKISDINDNYMKFQKDITAKNVSQDSANNAKDLFSQTQQLVGAS